MVFGHFARELFLYFVAELGPKEIAAEQLKPSPTDMKQFRLIDDIIPEPLGGAHNDPETVGNTVKQYINRYLTELTQLDTGTLVEQRIDRYANMGEFEEG